MSSDIDEVKSTLCDRVIAELTTDGNGLTQSQRTDRYRSLRFQA